MYIEYTLLISFHIKGNAAVTLQRLTPACARRVEHAANTLA